MRAKDLKEYIKQFEDEVIIQCCAWSPSSEDYTNKVSVELKPKLPRKKDFYHDECNYYERITVKDKPMGFCNLKDELIDKYSLRSCEDFIHRCKDVNYCLECETCYSHYECVGFRNVG